MLFTYRLLLDGAGWVAECVEATASGEGMTAAEAISHLREALEDHLRPEAVALPSEREPDNIELAPAEQARR